MLGGEKGRGGTDWSLSVLVGKNLPAFIFTHPVHGHTALNIKTMLKGRKGRRRDNPWDWETLLGLGPAV